MEIGIGISVGTTGGASAPPEPPANTVLPVISGTERVGQTLSTTDGTWTGTEPITYEYQWERDGVAIAGATNNTYLLVAADEGAEITVVVTATNTAGEDDAESLATGEIDPVVMMTGLALWFDAQDTASITKDGSNRVSQWADKSGLGHHAVQATGADQPLYVASSALNSKSTIQFYDDGTLNPLKITDHADFDFTSMSVFAVWRRDSDVHSSQALIGHFTQATNQRGWVHWGRRAAAPAEASFSTSSDGTGTNQTNIDTAAAIDTNFVSDAEWSSGNMYVAVNNGTRASTAKAAVHQATGDLYIGAINAGTAGQFRGYIGEILFYNRALTAGERTSVLQYLATKWGITIS